MRGGRRDGENGRFLERKLGKELQSGWFMYREAHMMAISLRTGLFASRLDIELLSLRKGGASSQGPLGCIAAFTLLETAVWNTLIL